MITELALDEKGMELDQEKIRFQFMREKPDLVVMSHVSNVTGYILPVEEIAASAKEYEAIVVVDGAQALGLVPISLKNSPIDFYVFAGHKTLYGPFGIGGFIYHSKYRLKHMIAGGTGSDSLNLEMPEEGTVGYEPGSPNIVAIAGLHASLEERMTYLKENADYFLDRESDTTVEEDFRSDSVFTRTSGKSRRNRVFQCRKLSGRGSGNDPGSGLSCGSPDWLPMCTAHS